jgi:hypothetical protein
VNGEELSYELEDDKKKAAEPVLTTYIAGLSVAGVVSIIIYFFPNMPKDIALNIAWVIMAVYPVVVALITRTKVWSPASVEKLVKKTQYDATEEERRKPQSPYQKYLNAKEAKENPQAKEGPPEFEVKSNTNEF